MDISLCNMAEQQCTMQDTEINGWENNINYLIYRHWYIKISRAHSHVDKKLLDCSHSSHRAFASRQSGWKVLPIDPPIARLPPTQLLHLIKTTHWNQIWKKMTDLKCCLSHVSESQPNKTPLGEATTARASQWTSAQDVIKAHQQLFLKNYITESYCRVFLCLRLHNAFCVCVGTITAKL